VAKSPFTTSKLRDLFAGPTLQDLTRKISNLAMSGARNHTHSVSEANVGSCGGELDYSSDEVSRVRRLIRRVMCLFVHTSCLHRHRPSLHFRLYFADGE